MKPDKFSVYELFERNRRYVVPLFQRPYVWDEENQWAPLWEDVTTKANELMERENRRDVVGAHFLGAAVINELPTFGREVPAYEIIDGQQRLTTLQILLKAFRDFLKNIGFEEFDPDLERLTENVSRKEDTEKYKVWPTTADRNMFEMVVAHKSPQDLMAFLDKKGYANGRLVEAYTYFYEAIDEYIQYGENDDEIDSPRYEYHSEMGLTRIENLMDAIRRHLEIVVIELEDDDDPQIIFETLNARGVPLLPSDLIRNFVFLEASRNGEDTEPLYMRYWYNYDNPEQGDADFWKQEDKQGRLKRPRIDLFFFYYVAMKNVRDHKISYLFQEFRRYWQQQVNGSNQIESHLQELNKYSDIYKQLVTATKDSRLGVFVDRLEKIGIGTVYPILFYLIGECPYLEQKEFDGIISDIESYLVRRLICRLTTKNYNRFFLSVLRDLKRADVVTRQVFQDVLLASDSDTARWPNDDEFRSFWLNNPVYRRLAQMRVRMILEAIDLQLETNKQENVHIDDNLTIEHVLPQNPDYRFWSKLAEEDQDKIHTFGNLTLLTTALNSSVSNGVFSKKRKEIARQSKLRMNVYFQDLEASDEWSLEDIEKRGNELFELAVQIWSRPDVKQTTKITPGQELAINSLIDIATQNNVGEEFKILLDTAVANNLYPRTSKGSIMYTPQENHARCLFTAWVNPLDGMLRVYVSSSAFPEFFDVDEGLVSKKLGDEGWRKMDVEIASEFSDFIAELLD